VEALQGGAGETEHAHLVCPDARRETSGAARRLEPLSGRGAGDRRAQVRDTVALLWNRRG